MLPTIFLVATLMSTPMVLQVGYSGDWYGTLKGIWDWLWNNILKPIVDAAVGVTSAVIRTFTAPFTALENVWNLWPISLTQYGAAAPLIGVAVVAAALIIAALVWKFRDILT